jgi:hypothetical protein
MRILQAFQGAAVESDVTAKLSFAASVFNALLIGLNTERVGRFGGYDRITMWDLARELRAGDGDVGLCFEWAVHDAIRRHDRLIWPLLSEVLEKHCRIGGGAQSLLFGPERDGRVPVLSSVASGLTNDSRLYVGRRGQPPKLLTYLPTIIDAFRRQDARARLPASINGTWKADLFVGNAAEEAWVATTVKIRSSSLESAPGLRVGVYPKRNSSDTPRLDDQLNLVRVPLPYEADFMETFYKAYYLVRAVLRNDGRCPPRESADLPDAEDRWIATELEARREYPVMDLIEWLQRSGQPGLVLERDATETASVDLTAQGIEAAWDLACATSLAPVPAETE